MVEKLLGPIEDVPEFYTDSVRIGMSLYSCVMEIGILPLPDTSASERPPARILARLRMSPHHALIFSMLLRKHLEEYQSKVGPIIIPDNVYRELGLQRGD